MHLFAHITVFLWLLGKHMLFKNMVEGHYPARRELCTGTWAQSDVTLLYTGGIVIVALCSQLLRNPTSQKDYYPPRSESSCSNTFPCFGVFEAEWDFFFVPVWCACRRLWTNDLLCFLLSLFFCVYVHVVLWYYFEHLFFFFFVCLDFFVFLKKMHLQKPLWKMGNC